ncbi:MAG: hypothetical protein JSR82_08025 [Verrucomicrobia bacterium]|nr:hypothetical protein [Verrucomicrobiota bacterium]
MPEDDQVRLLRFPAAPGDGRGGEILGLPGRIWMLPLAGLLLTLFLLTVGGWSPPAAAVPFGATGLFTWFFFHQRPPRFLEDWWSSRLLGPHAELSAARVRAARRDFHPYRRGSADSRP